MYHNELFGLRLRKLRNHNKETQKALAEYLGVKPMCEHYNISADYLLGLTDEPRPLFPENEQRK